MNQINPLLPTIIGGYNYDVSIGLGKKSDKDNAVVNDIGDYLYKVPEATIKHKNIFTIFKHLN